MVTLGKHKKTERGLLMSKKSVTRKSDQNEIPQPYVKATQTTQDQQKTKNGLKIKLDDLKTFKPLTENQQKFFDSYKNGDYFIALHGVSGTGKSFCAVYKALEEVLDKSNPFQKLIVVRSNVPSREVGHLPGDIEQKMEIYQQPYIQICETLFGRKDAWERLCEQGHVEFISTSFIRGMSFDNAIILVDEIQNTTWPEIFTVTTRCGYQSKIIFCGDYRQNDLLKKKNDVSGLIKFFDVARRMKSFTRIEFTVDDIVRSSLVRDFIIATMEHDDDLDRKEANEKHNPNTV